MEALQKSTKIY